MGTETLEARVLKQERMLQKQAADIANLMFNKSSLEVDVETQAEENQALQSKVGELQAKLDAIAAADEAEEAEPAAKAASKEK